MRKRKKLHKDFLSTMEELVKEPDLVKDELTLILIKALVQNCVELTQVINNLEKKQVKDS